MFDELTKLVSSLEALNPTKLENGNHPECREARTIMQNIKLEAQKCRGKLVEKMKARRAKTKDEIKVLKDAEKEEDKRASAEQNNVTEPEAAPEEAVSQEEEHPYLEDFMLGLK